MLQIAIVLIFFNGFEARKKLHMDVLGRLVYMQGLIVDISFISLEKENKTKVWSIVGVMSFTFIYAWPTNGENNGEELKSITHIK